MRFGALFVATLISFAASAQTRTYGTGTPGHWSIYSGETLAPGRDAVAADVGWPGITFGYLHGINDRTDVRVNAEILYGFEGVGSLSKFGFGLGAPIRLVLNRTDRVTLGVHIDPGFRVYTGNGYNPLLLRFPVGGTLAIHVQRELDFTVGIDVPFAIQVTSPAALIAGPQFGFALEYKVDPTLNVGLNTRFGPLFSTEGGGSEFAFTTVFGVGYKL